MVYLATFHWGWLLASLLLGFAMGWIAVVHRGQGVSKVTGALACGAGRRRCSRRRLRAWSRAAPAIGSTLDF